MGYSVVKILIVDDDAFLLRTVSRILSIEGYECKCVSNAEEGMELLAAEHFDLLISDVLMPGVSGNELLREVTRKFPDLSVIMMTGKDNKETFARCLTDKGYGYLIKPFSSNQLIINVKNALLVGKLRIENNLLKKRLQDISQLSDYSQ
jgi:putative two-component system response regulator